MFSMCVYNSGCRVPRHPSGSREERRCKREGQERPDLAIAQELRKVASVVGQPQRSPPDEADERHEDDNEHGWFLWIGLILLVLVVFAAAYLGV